MMEKMVQYCKNSLDVAEEESDSDVERTKGVDDDGVVNPGVIVDQRSRGRIRPTKDLIDAPSTREMDRLHTRFTKLALDIFSEASKLNEGVLEGIKREITELDDTTDGSLQ